MVHIIDTDLDTKKDLLDIRELKANEDEACLVVNGGFVGFQSHTGVAIPK